MEKLLDTAKANTNRKTWVIKKGTPEQVEVALAWANGEVSLAGAAIAFGQRRNQSYRTYSVLARALATYYQSQK